VLNSSFLSFVWVNVAAMAPDASWLVGLAVFIGIVAAAYLGFAHWQRIESLRQSEETLRSFFDRSTVGAYEMSRDGAFTRANAALARQLGCASVAEVLALPPSAVAERYVAPKRREEMLARAGAERQCVVYESEIRWPDGTRRVLSVNAARLSAPGTDLAVVSVLTDITDAVDNEDRLLAAMTAAEAANRAKSDFLAAMSQRRRVRCKSSRVH